MASRILIIDDEEIVGESLRKTLTDRIYSELPGLCPAGWHHVYQRGERRSTDA